MNWVQLEQLMSSAPTLAAAMTELNAWAAPPAPAAPPVQQPALQYTLVGAVDPMAGFPTTGFVDPMAGLILGPPAASPPGFGGMPLSGPVVPPLTDANAPAGAVDVGGGMFLFNDHGGGGT